MPTPQPNETQKDFVSRCIPIVLEEGTAKDTDQAVAVCSSMYQTRNSSMEHLTFNYTGGQVAERTFKGQKYIVAPLSMIVHGVLNGTKGPLYYPLEEIQKDPAVWNNTPIVVNHPEDNTGLAISARNPIVLEETGIGFVTNARVEGDKLVADGWFNVEDTLRVDERILNSIKSNQPVELSTGLFTDNEPEEGVFNGREYRAIARNYRPDHLAILPDKIGACSVNDGCGVLVNERQSFLDKAVKWLGLTSNKGMSHDELRMNLRKQLSSKFTQDEYPAYVEEVYDDFFIFSQGDRVMKQSYSKNAKGNIKFEGDPIKVRREVSYVTANKEPTMGKKELVDNLVANCSCWNEEDREVLNQFGEEKLQNLVDTVDKTKQKESVANAAKEGAKGLKEPEVKEKEGDPVANKEPQSIEEWFKTAPPEVQSVVRNAINTEQSRKTELVKTITSNQNNVFTEDQLKAMDLSQLEGMAKLAADQNSEAKQVANYFGAATPADNQAVADIDQEDTLPLPTINWNEKEAS